MIRTDPLPSSILIPRSGPIKARLRIPGSKSITNRALLIASLARGTSKLEGVLRSDDTQRMSEVCQRLGIGFRERFDAVEIEGGAGKFNPWSEELYIENAGTAARFLTAALTLGEGRYILTGNNRMRERPIGDLIKALNAIGATVSDINGTGCLPVSIEANGLSGGEIRIPGDKSSQYVSAIMMTAPYANSNVKINIVGDLVSRGYVEMTREIMSSFGARCQWVDRQSLLVDAGRTYEARHYQIEGDASSASYFFGAAAITKGEITVSGITQQSTQSDLNLLEVLERMGCRISWESDGVTVKGGSLRGVDIDMNSMSDVALTLAVIALFAEGETKIHNVANMRIKECDRISAICAELRKLGADVDEWDSGFLIRGMGRYHSAKLDTYNDHRLAMSLSLAGLRIPGIEINNPQCVSKTFPGFYELFLPLIHG